MKAIAYRWNTASIPAREFTQLELEAKETDLPRSGHLQTGYGSRVPTHHMVRLNGKWRRVYCAIFSNSCTLYVGERGAWEIIIADISE